RLRAEPGPQDRAAEDVNDDDSEVERMHATHLNESVTASQSPCTYLAARSVFGYPREDERAASSPSGSPPSERRPLPRDHIPMSMQELIRELREPNTTRIVLLVADGLGGLPIEPGGKTELETARTPNLDALAAEGTVGLSTPVAPGITPGSGPGHLGLFGFDP